MLFTFLIVIPLKGDSVPGIQFGFIIIIGRNYKSLNWLWDEIKKYIKQMPVSPRTFFMCTVMMCN